MVSIAPECRFPIIRISGFQSPDSGGNLGRNIQAMYEKDGLPFEKVLRNIINTRFLRPGIRPYKTQNIYAPFTGKEEPIAENKNQKADKGK